MRRFLIAALACAAVAVAGPQLAGAQTTMTGVVLSGAANPTAGIGALAIDCEPGGTSTVSYTMEGNSIGTAFPGTFEESGSFTITGGQVDSFNATFTITSGSTVITGTKTLRDSASASCQVNPEAGVLQLVNIEIDANYQATIAAPSGTSNDSGRAAIFAEMIEGTASASGTMQESFASEGGLVNTPGHGVGAGIFDDASHDRVVFAFTAKSDGTNPQAKCAVVTEGFLVKCLNATVLMQTDNHITFVGQALVNGVPTGYRIDADDLGNPGHGRDRFEIQTDSGFQAEGVLTVGNVKIFD
jgi:hypothetical protein